MAIKLYGIANCDKVKAARAWLARHGIAAEFHDFKRDGIDTALLDGWLGQLEWTALVNRNGTTWRRLPQRRRDDVVCAAAASALMMELPSVIKRPVLELDGRLHVGFDAGAYSSLLRRS